MKAIIVDDLLSNARMLQQHLSRLDGLETAAFTDPVAALSWCRDNQPDLILVDYSMPSMDGITFVRHLRRIPDLADVPVIMVTVETSHNVLAEALDAGANDFLRQPVDTIELTARVRSMLRLRQRQVEVAAAQAELIRLATFDALTGIHNRGHFMKLAADELERVRRYQYPLSLALIDIDRFKTVNDSYGHAAGDAVLVELSDTAARSLRQADLFGRIGGEEFAVVFTHTPLAGALEAAEKLRADIAARVVHRPPLSLGFTVSIGVAAFRGDAESLEALLGRADAALYAAKETGRNRVVPAA